MLGWSINLFRIRGIQLELHLSFFVLVALVAEFGLRTGGVLGLLWNLGTLFACFTCVVLHELGHSFTGRHFGIGVRRILLLPIGGMAEFDDIPRQPSRELLITLAGPAVNFFIAGCLWLAIGLPEGWSFFDYNYPLSPLGVSQLLLVWNLLMGCFNLAPVFPMDGGRILRALLAVRLPYLRATFWAACLGKVLAVAGIMLAIFLPERLEVSDAMLAILFGFILFAGEAEYRMALRRERDDERLRNFIARSYPSLPRPLDEPPLLSR